MSGGGGGGSGGSSYDPSQDAAPDCDALVFSTILSSPKSKVIATLKVGDVLEVVPLSATGPVVARASKGDAGSITHPWQPKLLECLNDGHKFKATVTALDGGSCQVEVRPKP
jgi:hypothetical protein